MKNEISEDYFFQLLKKRNSFFSKEIRAYDSKPVFPNYKETEIFQLIEEVKAEFYNAENSKWGLKNCLIYIQQNNIHPNNFTSFLNSLFTVFYSSTSNQYKAGKKTAFNFIVTLNKSKKFNQANYTFKKLELKTDVNILEFLADIKKVNTHLNLSNNDMVKFVYRFFNTGLSENTLRRYYYDQQK